MAKGLVHYTVSGADVNLLVRIGLGRQIGRFPQVAGEEYPAMVVKCPTANNPGDNTICDLLVFVDGAQPYFVRDVPAGAGQSGTYNAVAQKTNVG
jgi:hypothetical protein